MPDMEERSKAPSGASTLQHNIMPSDLNGNTSNSLTIELQSNSTELTEESIVIPSLSEVALRIITKDKAGVPMTVGESGKNTAYRKI
jgi:hypothetical protein